MRYDLAFVLCCCKSFLGPSSRDDQDDDENDHNNNGSTNATTNPTKNQDYYALLGISKDATPDEIKRAYKKQSLLIHPDKLAQRGLSITPELQAQFTQMKEAYDVLSDPYKRDTYDALGLRGMKWMEEPFSMDPQELVHNFAKSSAIDRSKIFAIFVAIAIFVFLQPILICLHVDGRFGPDALWCLTFIPLWLWNLVMLLYHAHVILMGPIQRPEHIPIEEWVDPLPMKKRIFSMVRFVLLVLFEVFIALKLDNFFRLPWFVVFIPFYVWEGTNLYKKYPLSNMRIVTVHDLEVALGKPFSEFTPAEKELIGKRYSVVSSTSSPDFDVAQNLKTRAKQDVRNSLFRLAFVVVLLAQLDGYLDWSWWLVFAPIWILSVIVCCWNYQAYNEVRVMAMEKDPTLFPTNPPAPTGTANLDGNVTTMYGSVGETTSESKPNPTHTPLTDDEREQIRAQVMSSSSKFVNKCCSQSFLLIILLLFVGKLQGADFSSLWIISPFLLMAGLILCCIGCAIFGVTEVPTEGVHFDSGDNDFAYMNAAETGTAAPNISTAATATNNHVDGKTTLPSVYVVPPSTVTASPVESNPANPVVLSPIVVSPPLAAVNEAVVHGDESTVQVVETNTVVPSVEGQITGDTTAAKSNLSMEHVAIAGEAAGKSTPSNMQHEIEELD